MGGIMADKNLLTTGIELYRNARYSDSLTFFLSLPSDSEADNNEIAYYLGLCYVKLGRYEDAMLYLEQVVTSASHNDRVLQCRFILAIIYASSGRKRLAEFELSKLKETGYKPDSVYAAMAFIAWEQNDAEKCFNYYQRSLEINSENVTALNGMGYCLACEDKDLTKALSMCKKAVDIAPDSAACLDSLGFVYYKLGLMNDARKYLEKAEQIDNENEEIAAHIRNMLLDGERA